MTEGIILGVMTWVSFLLMWWHSWTWVKVLTVRNFVITDIVVTAFTWFSITAVTHSLVGVIAAMVAGLLTNFTMMLFDVPFIKKYIYRSINGRINTLPINDR